GVPIYPRQAGSLSHFGIVRQFDHAVEAPCVVVLFCATERILIPPPSPRSIPSSHDGEVGRGPRRGQGEGISKERDNSMERAPLPSPLPARASQGEGTGDFSDGGHQEVLCATSWPLS